MKKIRKNNQEKVENVGYVINQKLLDILSKDRTVRRKVISYSHWLFFHVYFAHYIQYPTASFQKELFSLTENDSIKTLVVEAFRGSGKSTLMTLSLPIWAVLGKRKEKFVVILAKTQQQARQYLANIKKEIESNSMLRSDLGPFQEQEDEWRTSSIVIPRYGARITVASVESSLRGMRHYEHRPGLVIADDLEDLESVRQQEQRNKLWAWYTGDVIPMGNESTRYVVIGTRLHDDSLLMRLRKGIESGKRSGKCRLYPLLDSKGVIAWPGRFKTKESIEELKQSIDDVTTFEREYMLRIIPDDQRVVQPEWIRCYRDMPQREGNPRYQMTLTGIDLAISKETSADFTAMVSLSAFQDADGTWSAYIHSDPVNERLDFPEARTRIKNVSMSVGIGNATPIYIESVGYQKSMVQDLQHDGFPAEEFQVHGQDKRMRLSLVTHLIKNGIVQFPERRCEKLINQLIGFGTERHDDLADAFAIALHIFMDRMTKPGLVIPKVSIEELPKSDMKKEESEADDKIRLFEEAYRSNSPVAWCKYNDKMADRNKKYWQAEERGVFNKMMRGY